MVFNIKAEGLKMFAESKTRFFMMDRSNINRLTTEQNKTFECTFDDFLQRYNQYKAEKAKYKTIIKLLDRREQTQ